MRRVRVLPALLAALVICIAPATTADAQTASAPVREKAAPAPSSARPVAGSVRQQQPDTARTSKSVSQRLFDAEWVIFPARLALVIVFLTLALVLLMFGTWGAVRVAHSLRHTKWSQPPRRLKRGEVGAAGTSVALEFEERMHDDLEQNAARDHQLAALHEGVARLSQEHDQLSAAVAALLQRNPEVRANGAENPG